APPCLHPFPYTTLFRSRRAPDRPGDLATVYAATRRADFIRAWRESAAVRLLFAARGLGERAVSLIARREHREPPPPEPSLPTQRSEEHTSELQSLAYLV